MKKVQDIEEVLTSSIEKAKKCGHEELVSQLVAIILMNYDPKVQISGASKNAA